MYNKTSTRYFYSLSCLKTILEFFNHHANDLKFTFRRAASKYDFKLKRGFTSCVQKLAEKSRDSASPNSANLDGALSAGVQRGFDKVVTSSQSVPILNPD